LLKLVVHPNRLQFIQQLERLLIIKGALNERIITTTITITTITIITDIMVIIMEEGDIKET